MVILATAFAPKDKGGADEHEPVLFTVQYGKGRVFQNALGHTAKELKSVAFIVTFQRGVEWAASGKVTQKLPADFEKNKAAWVKKLADGSITAAPIFNRVLAKGVEGLPAQGWPEPPGITKARVCSPSGLLPTPDCPGTTTDIFLTGHVPTQPDNMWEAVEINASNGKRATACTPWPRVASTTSSAAASVAIRSTRSG